MCLRERTCSVGIVLTANVQRCVRPSSQVLLFAEELASVVLTPFILAFSLPNCAGEAL